MSKHRIVSFILIFAITLPTVSLSKQPNNTTNMNNNASISNSYIIEAGSFINKKNAIFLCNSLQNKGLYCLIYSKLKDKQLTYYVYISPCLNKLTVTELQKKLATQFNIHGYVTKYTNLDAIDAAGFNQVFEQFYVLQVGSFTKKENANALSEKLKKIRFRSFVYLSEEGGKKTYKTLIGPNVDKESLIGQQKMLDGQLNIKSHITTYDPNSFGLKPLPPSEQGS